MHNFKHHKSFSFVSPLFEIGSAEFTHLLASDNQHSQLLAQYNFLLQNYMVSSK